MNNILLKQIILSNKSFHEIFAILNCNVDDFLDKLNGVQPFSTKDMSLLTYFIPLHNPTEIFFGNIVDKKGTNQTT